MTTQTEALKLALEALERVNAVNDDRYILAPSLADAVVNSITAIKEALAQPEQEPDVYIPADALRQLKGTSLLILRSVPLYGYRGDGLTPLYTTQPQSKPLTDEQISLIAHNIDSGDWNDLNFKECWHEGFKSGFREAEIEHNIKGTT
jgi:hypothetical protein